MSTLEKFLQSTAEKRRNSAADLNAKRGQWIAAVRDLVQKLKGWTEESDRESKVLTIRVETVQIAEEELGTYNASELVITLDPTKVRVTPIGCKVVGGYDDGGIFIRAEGRVDITDGVRKYILYRIAATNSWKVVDPQTYVVKDFEREDFEKILEALLA